MVKELREEIKETPFVMMMYLNTIYRFGTERFFDLCNECGIQCDTALAKCGELMSLEGVVVTGPNQVTGRTESVVAYYKYYR